MTFKSIVISSGHGLYVRGASGILDEVDEARRVVNKTAEILKSRGIKVVTYHDDVSKTQSENLERITDFHNSKIRDLDISVHFNAYEQVAKPMGTEVLYLTQANLAARVSDAIAGVGFIDRGAKKRTDLYVLNNTDMPCILIETCFVDSQADADLYTRWFHEICLAIANALTDTDADVDAPIEQPDYGFRSAGKCSYFGGPEDTGVSKDEGLAFYDDVMQQPELFLPYQPDGTSGLARRLNPEVHYVACRWDYDVTSRDELRRSKALVTSIETGLALTAFPADWGPHEDTDRVADLSPGLLRDLALETDDEVEIIFPWIEE